MARIMREDNLLGMQPKKFIATTDSAHALEVYLNLARRMQLSGIDQLWVADITYIRLQSEFVYLAVILDGYSRKVVGWKLDRTLASRLAVDALQQAWTEPTKWNSFLYDTWQGNDLHEATCSHFCDSEIPQKPQRSTARLRAAARA